MAIWYVWYSLKQKSSSTFPGFRRVRADPTAPPSDLPNTKMRFGSMSVLCSKCSSAACTPQQSKECSPNKTMFWMGKKTDHFWVRLRGINMAYLCSQMSKQLPSRIAQKTDQSSTGCIQQYSYLSIHCKTWLRWIPITSSIPEIEAFRQQIQSNCLWEINKRESWHIDSILLASGSGQSQDKSETSHLLVSCLQSSESRNSISYPRYDSMNTLQLRRRNINSTNSRRYAMSGPC
jgi:hypothetical protein